VFRLKKYGKGISIHAPVKSATALGFHRRPDREHFNPRARKERDFKGVKRSAVMSIFQSTRP